ncbi:MAG: phytoene/squalene synthase family protein [Bacteroidota bacterium]
MNLFDQTSLECGRLITNRYSTSFSMGIRTLHPRFRLSVCGIYGFVRFADEIVDTFHEHNRADLLARFRIETHLAIAEKISLNPVLNAFQLTVNRYNIEAELIDAFLDSMATDLSRARYNAPSQYQQYIYGSAEVVGLMCLRVFCEGDNEKYEALKAPARSLGSAFQKVNFLRDMRSDYDERGRVYFPNADFHGFTTADKLSIEADIQKDFDDAEEGIKRLPKGARAGVYLAGIYYKQLFNKIRRMSPACIQNSRVRVPDSVKVLLLLRTWAFGLFST